MNNQYHNEPVWVEVNLKIGANNHKINIKRNEAIETVVEDFIANNRLSSQYMPLIVKLIKQEISQKLATEQQQNVRKQQAEELTVQRKQQHDRTLSPPPKINLPQHSNNHEDTQNITNTSFSRTHNRTTVTPERSSSNNRLLTEMLRIKEEIESRKERELSGLKSNNNNNTSIRDKSTTEFLVSHENQLNRTHILNPSDKSAQQPTQSKTKVETKANPTVQKISTINRENKENKDESNRIIDNNRPMRQNAKSFGNNNNKTQKDQNKAAKVNHAYISLADEPRIKEDKQKAMKPTLSSKGRIEARIQKQKSISRLEQHTSSSLLKLQKDYSSSKLSYNKEPEKRLVTDLSQSRPSYSRLGQRDNQLVTTQDLRDSINSQNKSSKKNSNGSLLGKIQYQKPNEDKLQEVYNKWKQMEEQRHKLNNQKSTSKSQPKLKSKKQEPQKHEGSFFYEKGKEFLTHKQVHLEEKFKQLYPFKPNLTMNQTNLSSTASSSKINSREVTQRLFQQGRAKDDDSRLRKLRQRVQQENHQIRLQPDPIREKVRQRDMEYDLAMEELIQEGKVRNLTSINKEKDRSSFRKTQLC